MHVNAKLIAFPDPATPGGLYFAQSPWAVQACDCVIKGHREQTPQSITGLMEAEQPAMNKLYISIFIIVVVVIVHFPMKSSVILSCIHVQLQ